MTRHKPSDFSRVTEKEIAYLAGFIDGEGCFYIGNIFHKGHYQNKYYFVTALKISNNNIEVLEHIYSVFGGRLDTQQKKTKDKSRNFITYNILFNGNQLTDITEILIPYLIVKKPNAELMKKMRATYPRGSLGNHTIDPEIIALRKTYHDEMHRLNSRFKNHPLKKDLYLDLPPCHPSAMQPGLPSQLPEI